MRSTALTQHSNLWEVTQSEVGSRYHSPTEWKSWVPERMGRRSLWLFTFCSSMKSWRCFWARKSFCSFSCRCGMERTLLQWLPIDFSKSAASQGNPFSLSLRLNCLCKEKRIDLIIFIPFSCSCSSGVASSCSCWNLRGSTAGSLLGAFSELISHFTPLGSPSHPSAWLRSCLSVAPASVLFTDSLSLISVFYPFLWEAAGYEEPLLLFCSPKAGFSRAHLWSQVVCGWKNWSCWIFGFSPKKTYLPWDLFLKN